MSSERGGGPNPASSRRAGLGGGAPRGAEGALESVAAPGAEEDGGLAASQGLDRLGQVFHVSRHFVVDRLGEVLREVVGGLVDFAHGFNARVGDGGGGVYVPSVGPALGPCDLDHHGAAVAVSLPPRVFEEARQAGAQAGVGAGEWVVPPGALCSGHGGEGGGRAARGGAGFRRRFAPRGLFGGRGGSGALRNSIRALATVL